MPRTHTVIPAPIGPLTAVRQDEVLVALWMADPPDTAPLGARDDAGFADVGAQLAEYFAGERTVFDLPLAPAAPNGPGATAQEEPV